MDNQATLQENALQQEIQESNFSNASLNLLRYANILYTQHNYEHAAVFYEKFLLEAKTLSPEMIEAYGKLSDCHINSGKVDEALSAAFQSFAFGTPHPVICYKIGVSFMNKNLLELAAFWYDMATKVTVQEHMEYDLSFSTWLPHLQLCVCYDRLGDREKSFQHHKLAQSHYPNHPSIVSNQQYFDSLYQVKTEVLENNEPKATDSDSEILDTE
ncbi:tetratricopeptide repeat protein [Paenibacillus sp. FSL M7-0420]|uniref:tetratricopeptide repeat protein n=1 Tax=Paenibacillus sp. FSL M7-0420 TaxID=2921609 RepID=UPI0030F7EF53